MRAKDLPKLKVGPAERLVKVQNGDTGWMPKIEWQPVQIMAECHPHYMCRNKGCSPFIAYADTLRQEKK